MAATSGDFNYYIDDSTTPMEDGVLVCPFDQPAQLAKNLENGALKTYHCEVKDARLDPVFQGVTPQDALQGSGIHLANHVSKVENFWDEQQILEVHYPEMAALAKELTGADITAVAAHALRRQGSPSGPRLSETNGMARDAAFTVHNDFSDIMQKQFLDMYEKNITTVASETIENGGLGISTPEEFRRGRFVVVNFWRSITSYPCTRNPLAVLDARTIGDSDIVLCRHPAKEENHTFIKFYKLPVPFINTLIRHNPLHQWHMYSSMTKSEVLVFKNYDSAGLMPRNGVGMHSSFHDPNTPSEALPRESIEVRVACFWKEEGL